ncbi:MAG: hypothetical protein GF410_08805 [Chitinivibrionales bacterium]|nr:hypothetical protein [Chitinivibrionales bacterium]
MNLPRPLTRVLRLVLAILPLLWIYSRVDLAGFRSALADVAWWTLPGVIATNLAAMLLQGFRWWLLMRGFIPGISPGKALSAHFKGLLYSIVLPTSAAQDVVRAAILSNAKDYPFVWGATWVCRLMGLLVLAFFSTAGFFLIGSSQLPSRTAHVIFAAFAIVIMLLCLSFTKNATRRIRPLAARLLPERILRVVDDIRQAIYLYHTRRKHLLGTFLLTILVQMLVIAGPVIMLMGIVGRFYGAECLFFIPTIEIAVISIPLTPNGIGLREALLSLFLLTFLALTPEQLGVYVAFSLLGVFLRVVGLGPVVYEIFVKKD